MLDLLPDGVVYYQTIRDESGEVVDFQLVYFNQQIANMAEGRYEVSPGLLLLGDNTAHEASIRPLFEEYKAVLTQRTLREYDYFDPNLKGYFSLRINKLNDGVLVCSRLIDKTASLRIQQQATLLQNVLNGSINGIMAYRSLRDEAGHIVDFELQSANKAAEEMLGQQAGEIVGKTLRELYPEEIEMGLFDWYCQAVERGEPQRTQARYHEPVGIRWLDLSANPLDDGIVVTFIDITSSREAQVQIDNQASLFRTMSQSVPDLGVLVCDRDYRILFANGDLPAIFLTEIKDLVGHMLEEILPAEMAAYIRQNFSDALAGRSRYMNEEIADQYYEVFVGPVNDSEGQTVMAVATLRNITAVKHAQQQLESSVNELKRSNQNLEQFAYVASHDLQEPLRKIQSFGDVLRDQYEEVLGDQGTDLIRRMQSAASRMSVLIRDLLMYSRIASYREAFGKIDLNQVLSEVTDDLEAIIADKKAIIKAETLPIIQGSALQLRQLFQNLLSNSLKFNRANVPPVIEITTQNRSATELPFWSESDKKASAYVEITVSDNGIGFDPAYSERIFHVFQRLHGRSEYNGTGIGLAIVQKVIENHQGDIRATAAPGEGATFTILLPCR
ncbi:sensor histidine kinase [Arsenicibacter rosenii]|uniref:histidine kinase n=1 Tax=Arsenicibacter rosenii TaxID=1750698 RepID=A0A1S2VH27_9BACT|nr:PAS domain-containing protein [Arsenicibacter rosenii]OIN58071.1 hypothetical protein BLX24_16205 [Arsenicibacter rosenii]